MVFPRTTCTQLNQVNNNQVQVSSYKQGNTELVAIGHHDSGEIRRSLDANSNSNSELSFDEQILFDQEMMGDWMPMDIQTLASVLDFGEDWFNLT